MGTRIQGCSTGSSPVNSQLLHPRLGSPQIQRASCTQEDTAALWPTKSPSLLRNQGGRLQMGALVTISAFSLWLIKNT